MVDNVAITAGSGTSIATDDIGGVQYQRIKQTWGPDGTANDTDTASGKALPIQLRSSTGEDVIKHEDDASAGADPGLVILAKRTDTPAASSGTDGDYEPLQVKGGLLHVRGSSRFISAAFSTVTRPANTTAYAANDAVSNNGTAGSVTALTATVGDVNDDPFTVERLRVVSSDTGVSGVSIRVYLFNSDPTASSGVGGGDNAAWSQKKAGFIGSLSGTFRAFSDGYVAILTPDEGIRIIAPPTSGAKTLYIPGGFQTLTAFTPSANSTTFDITVEGFQGRA